MINEAQGAVVEELADILDTSDLELGEVVEPLVFILADAMCQISEGVPKESLLTEVGTLLAGCYLFHCESEGSDSATITVQ